MEISVGCFDLSVTVQVFGTHLLIALVAEVLGASVVPTAQDARELISVRADILNAGNGNGSAFIIEHPSLSHVRPVKVRPVPLAETEIKPLSALTVPVNVAPLTLRWPRVPSEHPLPLHPLKTSLSPSPDIMVILSPLTVPLTVPTVKYILPAWDSTGTPLDTDQPLMSIACPPCPVLNRENRSSRRLQ